MNRLDDASERIVEEQTVAQPRADKFDAIVGA